MCQQGKAPKAKSSPLLPLVTSGAVILIIDQVSKILVVRFLGPGRLVEVIPGCFSLVCNFNTGAAFGLFRGSQAFLAVISVIAMVVLPFLIRGSLREGSPTPASYGLMAILAGDVGNLVDRVLRDEGVVDFLYFYLGSPDDPIVSWFPFNVADSAICVGVAIYILHTYITQRRKESRTGR
jgi:signal peptidase II